MIKDSNKRVRAKIKAMQASLRHVTTRDAFLAIEYAIKKLEKELDNKEE